MHLFGKVCHLYCLCSNLESHFSIPWPGKSKLLNREGTSLPVPAEDYPANQLPHGSAQNLLRHADGCQCAQFSLLRELTEQNYRDGLCQKLALSLHAWVGCHWSLHIHSIQSTERSAIVAAAAVELRRLGQSTIIWPAPAHDGLLAVAANVVPAAESRWWHGRRHSSSSYLRVRLDEWQLLWRS